MARWTLYVVIVALSGTILPGCLDESEPSILENDAPEEFLFEWNAPSGQHNIGHFLDIQTGAAECQLKGSERGSFWHESGMGFFDARFNETGTDANSAVWSGDKHATVHAGEVNVAHLSRPVWEIVGGGYEGGVNQTIKNESRYARILTSFQIDESYFALACTSDDVRVLFYEADALMPFQAPTATGGTGVHVDPGAVSFQSNQGDILQAETQGDFVFFQFIDWGIIDGIGDSHLEGRLDLDWPTGQQTYQWKNEREGEMCFWSGSGTYTVNLDRLGVNADAMQGLLAGFKLVGDLGSLQVDADPTRFRQEDRGGSSPCTEH